ncbi:hypothetical protein E1286_04630 [Nonomuraea terrae]|uniref:LLM class flavin-dependent oxidoreductase n=1 Tax=Nonomuraea terrae TaxID=2530383 RepID=A0A4R4ZAY9_9ACTN|nr:hypothetical protein [Nonomuraea terrae]TDD54990.1 hypothetical protein E1286_04630 [Nonomuraea terrae]
MGAGTAGYFGHCDSQAAAAKYRPVFEARLKVNKRYDRGSIKYDTVEDWIANSSVLVGSPQQIIEKVSEQHRLFGHEVMHIHVDGEILAEEDYRATLELLFTDIAPVLRKELPSRSLDEW